MIRSAIYTLLLADSTLSALTTNISHGIMNQETNMPYVTFLVTQDPNYTKDTLSETDEVFLSVSCISNNNLNAVAIADAVRGALDGYSGTSESTVIQSCDFEKMRDAWLQEAKAYQIVVEFSLFIKP